MAQMSEVRLIQTIALMHGATFEIRRKLGRVM